MPRSIAMTTESSGVGLRPTAEAERDHDPNSITLEDLFIHFTPEEWEILDDNQKLLYYDVMTSVYTDVLSLGLPVSRSFQSSQPETSSKTRTDMWFSDFLTMRRMARNQPTTGPSSTGSTEGESSQRSNLVRATQERPLQADPGTIGAPSYQMFKTIKKEFPVTVQHGMHTEQQRQGRYKSGGNQFSFLLQENDAKFSKRESGEPSSITNPWWKGPENTASCSSRFLAPQQAIQDTEMTQREAPDTRKRYKCRKCQMIVKGKENFIEHQALHNKEKCPECGKTFQFQSALAQHQKFHSGERPHQCKRCGESFLRKASLKAHKDCYVADKTCKCDECGKFLSSHSYLERHKKGHSINRPFECSECEESFVREAKLKAHKKLHTTATQVKVKNSPVEAPATSTADTTAQ